MGSYVPSTLQERQEMLESIGLSSICLLYTADYSPEVLLLAVAKLSGKTAHHLFHRSAVAQVEGILIVLLEQFVSLWLCPFCLHIPPSFPVIDYSVFLL